MCSLRKRLYTVGLGEELPSHGQLGFSPTAWQSIWTRVWQPAGGLLPRQAPHSSELPDPGAPQGLSLSVGGKGVWGVDISKHLLWGGHPRAQSHCLHGPRALGDGLTQTPLL